jgi:hypothetical protein
MSHDIKRYLWYHGRSRDHALCSVISLCFFRIFQNFFKDIKKTQFLLTLFFTFSLKNLNKNSNSQMMVKKIYDFQYCHLKALVNVRTVF